MKRRKLFGDYCPNDASQGRRKLFSDSAVNKTCRKLFNNNSETEENILICYDCGYQMKTNGSTTEYICPNCGGRRFNFLKSMTAPADPNGTGSEKCEHNKSENEINKTFSEIRENINNKNRKKLFSSLTNIQPNKTGERTSDAVGTLHEFKCNDCSIVFKNESESSSGLRCPGCGGNRIVRLPDNIDFGKDDKTDEFLKEFSGKTISSDSCQKIFSERGIKESVDSMIDSGYARETEDGQICFSETADFQRKLFSKLVISVTKLLELEPVDSKEEMINKLEEAGNLPPKSIILIKKAHNIIPTTNQNLYSENDEEYLKDSGIVNDLRLEYGGTIIPLKDFMSIISEQYNDAPENILDLLVNNNTIKISGSQVEILK